MTLLTKEMVAGMLQVGDGFKVDIDIPPKFSVGDRIRARDINPEGHTRLPRYARGRQGVIHKDHGVFVFPDTMARGEGKPPSTSTACVSCSASSGVPTHGPGIPFM